VLRNYIIVAWRNLARDRTLSTINVLGLAVGMACCLLILQYVRYELGHDRQHPEAERLYRVLRETRQPDGRSEFRWGVSGPLGPAIQAEIPDAELVTRRWSHWVAMRAGDRNLMAGFAVVDANYFDMFDCPLVDGRRPTEALRQPGSILLTEAHAERYFGDENPIGQAIHVDNAIAVGDYVIAGVLQDYEPNMSVEYGFLTTHPPTEHYSNTHWTDWLPGTWRMTVVYVRLREGANAAQVETQLHGIMERNLGPEVAATDGYRLQAVTRTHLYSGEDFGMPWGRSVDHVYAVISVAGLVVLIAGVNFVNLSTARSARRSREVGIRKVSGSQRGHLVGQFLMESVLTSLLAGGAALAMAQAALPSFNELIQLELRLGLDLVPRSLALAVAVGLLAGAYPALYLASFQTAQVLKGGAGPVRAEFLRRGLVVFQFAVSTVLIIGTTTVYHQLAYIAERDMGYQTEGIVSLPEILQSRRAQAETVKGRFAQHPNVLATSGAGWQPLMNPRRVMLRRSEAKEEVSAFDVATDTDFLETYGLPLLHGRNMRYKEHRGLGSGPNEFLVNETAVRALGWEESPLGQELLLTGVDEMRLYGKSEIPGTVVGVLKDFQFRSAHHPMQPLLVHQTYWVSDLHLRVRAENFSETLAFLKATWEEVAPELVFRYEFLDDQLASAYAEERQTAALSLAAAGMAIFVACLGVLGLAAFAAERRSREIGIRKVLGASVANLLRLLSGQFVRLALLANLIAWPIAYLLASGWLESFAYRVDLGIETFAISGLIAVALALGTVAAQAMKAAVANPADVLRSE